MSKKTLLFFTLFILTLTGCRSFNSINLIELDVFDFEEETSSTIIEVTSSTEETSPKETLPRETIEVNELYSTSSQKDSARRAWSFKRNTEHLPTTAYINGIDIDQYNAYYLGDTTSKEIFLTFDEGYEYGFTPTILDTLKENNIKACFFLTKDFIVSQPELAKRIKEEGHVVGNHSVTHPSMAYLTVDEIIYEIEETARYYNEVTGYDMDPFFRPPMGEYSEKSLYVTNSLGYKTIFWSLAYRDFDVNNQPGKEAAYNHVIENYHNGGIFLLHAVSQSNTEALDDIIKTLKSEGYTFKSLYTLQ